MGAEHQCGVCGCLPTVHTYTLYKFRIVPIKMRNCLLSVMQFSCQLFPYHIPHIYLTPYLYSNTVQKQTNEALYRRQA
jgi:hypothetical protein